MKKQLIFIIFHFLFFHNLNAQQFEWAKSMGGKSGDVAYSMTIDDSGYIYLTGTFLLTADLDPGLGIFNLTSAGRSDIFVLKLDSSGNFIWAKSMGGASQDEAFTIFVDKSRNVYTGGLFEGTADFNPGAGTFNLTVTGVDFDGFISKLDASGNFLWAISLSGEFSHSSVHSIYVDALGNVYATGRFSGIVDFNPGVGIYNLNSIGGDDIFILKLDAAGNFIWVKQIGGEFDDSANSIVLDSVGNIYTTGEFEVMADFDPGVGVFNLTSIGREDIFLLKLDSTGNFVWAKRLGGDGNGFGSDDQGSSIVLDAKGNLYTIGTFRGTADFDPGPATHNLVSLGGTDVYVLKLDSYGNYIWAQRFGGDNNFGRDIAIDKTGNVYTTGQFQGTGNFNPGSGTFNLSSKGHDDAFISKLDDSGNFVWAKQIGGAAGEDRGISIVVDATGNVYTAGYFYIKADFNPGPASFSLTSAGDYDIFVHKMSQCENSSMDVRTACDSLVWIDGKTYKSSNNSATHTLKNAKGCDSLVSLDLHIYKSYSKTLIQTACDSFNWNGKIYYSSGKYEHNTQSQYGCDSSITLDLTVLRSSSFTEQITACDQYNWYGQIFDNSGTYSYEVKNKAGCDSIRTLELKINRSNAIDVQFETCDSYTWNGQIYTQSGMYVYDTINRFGCDSSITLNLIVNKSTKATIADTVCHALNFNNILYSNSGKYYQTIKNGNGCDSLIELNLNIIKSDTVISKTGNTLIALENNANYQWVDCNANYSPIPGATQKNFVPLKDGSYAVILSSYPCIDTSSCVLVVLTRTTNSSDSNINVYPNPAFDQIHLQITDQNIGENFLIHIKDMQGRIVSKKLISMQDKTQLEIDISSFPGGIYYLSLISAAKINTISFSKI